MRMVETYHSLSECMGENALAKARGVSTRTDK